MSGGHEQKHIITPELVTRAMTLFSADEKTARKIIDFGVILAMEKIDKWTSNRRRIQKEKADIIFELTKRLKNSGRADIIVVNEIEKKIMELCVGT